MAKTKDTKKPSSGDYVRIEISIPFSLVSQFDEEAERRGYNRSEAIRAAMRNELERWTGRRL